ncbi:cytochrome b/b6 domain-containing protein [Sphingobium algorifonticola]|uniref:Polyisoprenoid-binding protein n=1 Tax=Sphingobium algorifonticola TaxID=2008318 RepID=A0A437JBL0_9SPHN|nr:cytochrome b/b6 domain-containing protein [Sphingobium algorifonticola]RVT43299.1 polyisoprenoid-binding protein [Sphingobium algorifonticola]
MHSYSRTAIILHWAIAAALAFQFSVGWSLETLGQKGFALYQLHKSVGMLILALTLARVLTRLRKPRPAAMEGGWEGALAKGVHIGLYGFMLLAPLSGWALVSTAKIKVPTLLFGTVPLPHLPLPQAAHELSENAHGLLGWIGVALFALHVAGAIRHHLLLRDGLIWRMVPGRSVALMAVLIALIPGAFVIGGVMANRAAGTAPAAVAAPAAKVADVVAAQEAPATNASEPVVANAAQPENMTVADEAAGPPPLWTVRPGGTLGFSVGNGSDRISGGFSRWTARIVMDPDRPETADIRVEIDMASAHIGDPTQDEMLPNDEFLGVAAHPKAIFVAKGARATGADGYSARGTLTLKGVSAPQTIRFTLKGAGLTRSVSGSATIARQTFGVGNGDSSTGLDPSVAVSFRFEATGKTP